MSTWQNTLVTVTGGAGFIGSTLCKSLVGKGAKVRAVDNLERGNLDFFGESLKNIEFVEGDLRDPLIAKAAFARTDVVFHLASKVGGISVYMDRPYDVLATNLQLDINVAEALVANRVKRCFYASSAHIYPIELQRSADAPAITEDQALPAHPQLSYGWGKLIGEQLLLNLQIQHPDIRIAVGRIIGAFGPNQDYGLSTGSAIPVFIRRAIEYPATPLKVLGSGRETRSFCYVDDIVDAIILSAEKLDDSALVGPINLGREGYISIGELARLIVEISGKDISLEFNTAHPTLIWGQAVDLGATRKALGWEPKISLREGLEREYRHIEHRLGLGG